MSAQRLTTWQWSEDEPISSQMSMVPQGKRNSFAISELSVVHLPGSSTVLSDDTRRGIQQSPLLCGKYVPRPTGSAKPHTYDAFPPYTHLRQRLEIRYGQR